MYKNVMVPLDGSKLAECVLPHVEILAKGCLLESVTFVRVVEPVRAIMVAEGTSLPEKEWQRLSAERKAETDNYLKKLLDTIKYINVKVKVQALEGQVADRLAEYATKNKIDLIVVATHGRSGVSRWVWGSIADRVLRSACVPVLMVRAPGCIPGA